MDGPPGVPVGGLDGQRELFLAGANVAVAGAGEAVPEAKPREALRYPLLVGLRRVAPSAVELDVARVQPRVGPLHPRHEVLADRRADVEDDRRGGANAGFRARGQDLVEMFLVVREPREDRRDEDSRTEARLRKAAEDLETPGPR